MKAKSTAHPKPDELQAFGLGKLDPATFDTVIQHLETCDECRTVVAESSGDGFIDRLRKAQNPDGTPSPDKWGSGLPRTPSPASGAYTQSLPAELSSNPEYRGIEELGRGGMGVVYKVHNTLMGRDEVLKVMGKEIMARPGALERFRREIQSAARLNHANVVRAYSARMLGELLVFTMEFVPGNDLGKLVKSRGPLPVQNTSYYVQQVANGLQHAHEKGMVHRDIKPANLILSVEGKKHVVKILDFGLAKATSENRVDGGLTGEGRMMGTPDYMAPEQAMDAARADIRADIYSLGCTFYYLLTGDPPFGGNSLLQLLQAHQTVEAKRLNLIRPEVPMELAAVVSKMMAKDPIKRYQTPSEVAKALSPFTTKPATLPENSPCEFSQRPVPTGSLSTEAIGKAATVSTKLGRAVPLTADNAQETPPKDSTARSEWESSQVTQGKSTRRSRGRARTRSRIWLWPTLLGSALALLMVGLWGGGLLDTRVKTKDGGTIVFENFPSDAQVLVDGETVTVSRNGEQAFVTTNNGGPHKLKVMQAGKEIYSSDLTIILGGDPVRIRVEKAAISDSLVEERKPPLNHSGVSLESELGKLERKFFAKFDKEDPETEKRGHGETGGNYIVRCKDHEAFSWNVTVVPASFAVEVVGRIRGGKHGRWGININNPVLAHGIMITLDCQGQLFVQRGKFEGDKSNDTPKIGPATHSAIKTGEEYNRLLVVLRDRVLEVLVNGEEVIKPILIDRHVSPADISLTAIHLGGSVNPIVGEIKQLTWWNVDKLPPLDRKRVLLADSSSTNGLSWPQSNKSLATITSARIGRSNNPNRWSVTPNGLEANGEDGESWLWFGDPEWTNYTLTFTLQKISGPPTEAMGVLFRAPSLDEFFIFEICDRKNDTFALAFYDRGKWYMPPQNPQEGIDPVTKLPARKKVEDPMKEGRSYQVKVVVNEDKCQCYFDKKLMYEYSMKVFSKGLVGFRALSKCALRITDLQIRGPKNELFWEGYPLIPKLELAVNSGSPTNVAPAPHSVPNPQLMSPRKPGEEIEVDIGTGVKMRFCWVPAGKAMLGSPVTEKGRGPNEKEHEFTTQGFWFGKYPVTQEEWRAIMGTNPSNFQPKGKGDPELKKAGIKNSNRFPVENVTWVDTQEYLRKMNLRTKAPPTMGNGLFALPTENQWEFACRGGKGNTQPYYFGDLLDGRQANCGDTGVNGQNIGRTSEVGAYEKVAPHPWGLCDMHGNVWQWCVERDWNGTPNHICRGGSWVAPPDRCRSAYRFSYTPAYPHLVFGLRVCFCPE